MSRLLAVVAVTGMLTSCGSSKISLLHTAPAGQTAAAAVPVNGAAEDAPAAAQTAPSAEAYASVAEEATAVTTVPTTLEKAARETAAKPHQTEAKKLSLPARMVAKALVKKMEKAEKKFDGQKNQSKKAVSDPQIRTGIIIALVGLGLILVGALIGSGLLYGLGGIGVTVGLIIILLAALDVI